MLTNQTDIIEQALLNIIEGYDISLEKAQQILADIAEREKNLRLEGSTTNSPIGSQHWYNTLLGQIARDAEYMAEYPIVPADHYNERLKGIAVNARILLDNYNKIPFNY